MTNKTGNLVKGKAGEEKAAAFLKKNGYKILCRNWRSAIGEIDIVAREEDTIVFVEVKSRTGQNYGNPEEAVNYGKQQKIIKASLGYLKSRNLNGLDIRFDVVSITGENIELIRNAFQADGRYWF